MSDYIITFHTVSDALYFEKIARSELAVETITVPRKLSTSCGYAIRASDVANVDQIDAFVQRKDICYSEIFLAENGDYHLIATSS